MLKILINPGHCGCEPGAVSGKLIERELNLKTALALEKELKNYAGVEIYLTRRTNSPCNGVHISDVIKEAKEKNCSLIFSVHHNSGGGKGAETYYQPHIAESKRLAELVQGEYTAIGRPSRGVKNGGKFRLLNGSAITTVMTEYAFIDHPTDKLSVSSDAALEREAKADAAAIVKMYGLKLRPIDPPKPSEKPADIKAGDKITLSNVPLFASASADKAARKISGSYFIYDGKEFNGRYRITISADRCGRLPVGNNVTGYVNASDLTPSTVQPEPIEKGGKLTLKDTPLYASSTSAKPTGRVTGAYYLYDGVRFGSRYRITVSPEMCGKKPIANNVTGYIDAGDVR